MLDQHFYKININSLMRKQIVFGTNYILDLFECLQTIEDGMPIHSGRTHPLVGLLGRPVQSWPRYDRMVFSSGNEDTTDLLLGIMYKNRFTN